jgi:hypothetical protein
MVKATWFRSHAENERLDPFDRVVQSWDTANKASELSDFSVCTSWGIKGKDLYLLHVLRRRMEYPELRRAVREQAQAPCQLKQPKREIRSALTVGNPGDLRTRCNRSWCPKCKLDKAGRRQRDRRET